MALHPANSTAGSQGGIGILGVLGIVFIVLKLVGVIDWSWWWVLAPFWGPLALGLAMLTVVMFIWALGK